MRLATTCLWALAWILVSRPGVPAAEIEPPDKRGLLIVAPERFVGALERYAAHKRSQLPTDVAKLERILKDSSGVDDPERLKRFLFHQWKEMGIRYALLVGDADVLPVRYMVLDRKTRAAFDYAFYPSDLYYADLANRKDGTFDDWNARKEEFHAGYFGEVRGEKNKDDPINYDEIDYLPDVAVGRWPVSDEREVRIVAEKTIAYERGLRSRVGARRVALVCVRGWVDCRGRMDRWADLLAPAWSAERRYFAGGSPTFQTPPPSAEEVVRLLNEGAGLILHAGHGRDLEWEQSFSHHDIAKLENADRLGIMASAGCSTARFASLPPYEHYTDVRGEEHRGTDRGQVFDEPPPPPAPYQRGRHNPAGLGEALLRRGPTGAVAYFGCNTGGQPCGITLLEGLVDGLRSGENRRLGDCWSHAIAYYYEKERLAHLKPTEGWYPPSIFFQGMKYMLFGDPSLLLPLD